MADAIESARKVFDLFQDTYEAFANRPNQLWAVDVYDEGVGAGLSDSEIGAGTRVLVQKGLIRARTTTQYMPTDLGLECCLHPKNLDKYLAPRFPGAVSQNISIHGGQNQIGDGNTQNITYRTVFHEALQLVEEREDVPAPIAGALRRLREYPDIDALMTEATERARK